jgi:hypothetical protein
MSSLLFGSFQHLLYQLRYPVVLVASLTRQPRPQLRTDDAGANPWGAHTETCRILSDPEMQAEEGSTDIYGIYVFQFSGKKVLTLWAWNAPTDSS